MRRLRVGALSVVVLLTLVAPVAVAAVLVLRAASESPLESDVTVAPLVGTVETAERSGESVVSIGVEFADALTPTLRESGTLTALSVGAGDVVGDGDAVAQVDDRSVVAYTADSPLWRDITRGSRGDDVAVAQQLLADWGYAPGPVDSRAGYQTEQAIRRFNADLGRGDKNPVLSLSALVWIGPVPVTVDTMAVSLGDTVTPGAELFSTTAGLAAITVSEPPSLDASAEYELVVGDTSVPYALGSGRITEPEAVAAIAAHLGTFTEGVGSLRLVTPVRVATVPSSAVFTDELGRVCVFPSVDGPPLEVEPRGGTLGTVDLDVSLVGQEVLLNPREVREDLTCGS